MCRELTPYSLLYCGHARSLCDVDRSTATNEGQAPGTYAVLHSGLARHAHRLCLDTRGGGWLGRTGTHFPPSQGSTGLLQRSIGGLRRQSLDGPTTERRHEDRDLTVAARSIDSSRVRLDPITRPLHR